MKLLCKHALQSYISQYREISVIESILWLCHNEMYNCGYTPIFGKYFIFSLYKYHKNWET